MSIERTKEDVDRFHADMQRIASQTAQHTPGPWRVNGYAIEDCASPTTPIAGLNYTDDESEATANARLIAAAPQLLAALEAITAELHDLTERDDWWAAIDFADSMARDAIAQARGQ